MREPRKAACGEGAPTPVVPPTLGSASCFGPQSLRLFSSSAWRACGVAACLQMSQVTSVSLDLRGSHLDDQAVADETVWSNLRHELQLGSFHFVVAGPPSSTVAHPVRDPQHVYRNPNSTARKRGLHPSHVDGIRIADLSAERTSEAHRLQATVVPIARPAVLSCVGGTTSRQWWRSTFRRSPRRAVSPDAGSQMVGNSCGDTVRVGRVQVQCSAVCRLLQLR